MRTVRPTTLLLLLLLAADVAVAQTSLNLTSNAIPARDRVMIRIDPHVPADVGLDFTLEFWMKANAADNPTSGACAAGSGENWITGRIIFDRAIFNHDRNGDYGLSIFRSGSAARLAFGILRFAGGSRESTGICGTTNVADGAWHHIAVTRNGANGRVRIYVDGRLDVQGTGPTGDVSYADGVPSQPDPGIPLDVDNYLGIGAEKFDADGTRYPSYNGLIDEVRISRVIRYPENQDAFTPPTQPFAPDAQTAALYHFDEGSGSTIVDSAPGGASPGERWSDGNTARYDADTPFGSGPGTSNIQFSQGTVDVPENAGRSSLVVTRSAPTAGTASVLVRLSQPDAGTATQDADYTLPAQRTLEFATGVGSLSFDVSIVADAEPESAETVRLELADASGAGLGPQRTTTLTITDDDSPQRGRLRFTSAQFVAPETGGSVTISVERVGGADGAASVGYTTGGGTATAGTDYTASSGTLSWTHTESGVKSFDVAISNDNAVEGNETVSLTLANAIGASLATPASATLTIADDETPQPGIVRFTAATFAVGESAGSGTISVERTNGSAGPVTVDYVASAGTATVGSDFTAANGSLAWADGETGSRSFAVAILDDGLDEPEESVALALSAPMGGLVVGTPASASLRITDDDAASPPAPPSPTPPTAPATGGGGGGRLALGTLLVLLFELASRRGGPSGRAALEVNS